MHVETGSDAHDLDAPLPGVPKMSGLESVSVASNTYGALGGPFWFGGGAGPCAEQIEVERARGDGQSLPSFGALQRDNTPTAALRGLRMITMAK